MKKLPINELIRLTENRIKNNLCVKYGYIDENQFSSYNIDLNILSILKEMRTTLQIIRFFRQTRPIVRTKLDHDKKAQWVFMACKMAEELLEDKEHFLKECEKDETLFK